MKSLLGGIIVAYLLGMLVVSLYAGRRVHNEEDYVVAGRRLPLGLAWATLLATWFGAATLLGAAEAARNEGLRGTLLDPFASGLALIVAGLFFARRLWKMRLLTIADFYGRVFGTRAEVVASFILVPGYFGWIAAQYLALAGIQVTFFSVDFSAGIVIAAAIILVYTVLGGMWSVTLTDALQMSVVLVTLVILGAVTFTQLGDGSAAAGLRRLLAETPSDLLTIWPTAGAAAAIGWAATLGTGVFGNVPGQDLMQRVFSARDARTAARACVLAGAIYLSFGLIPVGLGLASRLLMPARDAGEILAVLASQYLQPGWTIVFVVSLVSIIVSTATSAVLSPATILAHNLLGRLPAIRVRPLTLERIAVVLVSAFSLITAFSGRTILELLELSLSLPLVTLFVPLVGGMFWTPRGERQAILAMAFGALVWVAREALQWVLLPMPEYVAALGSTYPEYVASTLGPDGPWNSLLYGFAVLPSAVSGTAASLAGYLLGGYRADRGARRTARAA